MSLAMTGNMGPRKSRSASLSPGLIPFASQTSSSAFANFFLFIQVYSDQTFITPVFMGSTHLFGVLFPGAHPRRAHPIWDDLPRIHSFGLYQTAMGSDEKPPAMSCRKSMFMATVTLRSGLYPLILRSDRESP